MLDDKFRLPATEVAARDRIYAYLSEHGSGVMNIILEPSLRKSAQTLLGSDELMSLCKIFCVVAVREIWQQAYPTEKSPVGSWESIDMMRQGAGQDVRVQAVQIATEMHLHYEGEAFECRQAAEEYSEQLAQVDPENNIKGLGLSRLLPVVMERLIQMADEYGIEEDSNGRSYAVKKLVKAMRTADLGDVIDDDDPDFLKKVDLVVDAIQEQVDEERKEEDDG